jgi:hypothetical protein
MHLKPRPPAADPREAMSPSVPTEFSYAGWPITAPGLIMAQIGPLLCVYNDESITDDGWDLHVREMLRSIDLRPRGRKVGVVYDVPSPSAIDGRRRAQLATALDSRRAQLAASTGHYSLATGSSIVRAYLKTVFWLAPPPYPWSIVATTREAFVQVSRAIPAVDPIACHQSWEALVSRHAALLLRTA